LRTTIRKLNVEGSKEKNKDPRSLLENDSQLRMMSIASAEGKDAAPALTKTGKLPSIKIKLNSKGE